ncbi:MAG: hypothetical protein H6707_17745 [Deltaproteobacteria bacterium]|nr:hypothetical protein [Deltaproteobacteria bacterium]
MFARLPAAFALTVVGSALFAIGLPSCSSTSSVPSGCPATCPTGQVCSAATGYKCLPTSGCTASSCHSTEFCDATASECVCRTGRNDCDGDPTNGCEAFGDCPKKCPASCGPNTICPGGYCRCKDETYQNCNGSDYSAGCVKAQACDGTIAVPSTCDEAVTNSCKSERYACDAGACIACTPGTRNCDGTTCKTCASNTCDTTNKTCDNTATPCDPTDPKACANESAPTAVYCDAATKTCESCGAKKNCDGLGGSDADQGCECTSPSCAGAKCGETPCKTGDKCGDPSLYCDTTTKTCKRCEDLSAGTLNCTDAPDKCDCGAGGTCNNGKCETNVPPCSPTDTKACLGLTLLYCDSTSKACESCPFLSADCNRLGSDGCECAGSCNGTGCNPWPCTTLGGCNSESQTCVNGKCQPCALGKLNCDNNLTCECGVGSGNGDICDGTKCVDSPCRTATGIKDTEYCVWTATTLKTNPCPTGFLNCNKTGAEISICEYKGTVCP